MAAATRMAPPTRRAASQPGMTSASARIGATRIRFTAISAAIAATPTALIVASSVFRSARTSAFASSSSFRARSETFSVISLMSARFDSSRAEGPFRSLSILLSPPSGRPFHRELRLEALAITKHARDRQHAATARVTHDAIALLDASIDLDAVPTFRMPDVVDGDVVVLGPKDRHVGERRAIADDRARDRLALSPGHNPVLDPDEPAAARVGPTGGIADRVDAFRRRLERRVHDDPLVDGEPCLLGERRRRLHAHARHDEVRAQMFTVVEDDGVGRDTFGRMAQMEDDAVLLVKRAHEIPKLRTGNALERASAR